MKTKTAELIGAALDWAVAKCEDELVVFDGEFLRELPAQFSEELAYSPSKNWAQGGPIIERHCIEVGRGIDSYVASTNKYWWYEEDGGTDCRCETRALGGDYLEAAMRCYVASKLGDEIEVPDELI